MAITLIAVSFVGVTTRASAASKGTITIANTGAYSGSQASPEVMQAIEAYFDQANAHGGMNGYKVKVETCDQQGSSVLAANCVSKLAADRSVVAFLGNVEDETASEISLSRISELPKAARQTSPRPMPSPSPARAQGMRTTLRLLMQRRKAITRLVSSVVMWLHASLDKRKSSNSILANPFPFHWRL